MSKSNQKPEHLFITNPFTGKLTNVLPLFELMNEQSHYPNSSAKNIVSIIQDIHDYTSSRVQFEIGTEPEDEFNELKTINFMLIQLRKTFEKME